VEEDAFILTTDADVKFSPDSVEALLDLMTRDTSVGPDFFINRDTFPYPIRHIQDPSLSMPGTCTSINKDYLLQPMSYGIFMN
jgi:hypothetical protein